MSDLAKKFHDTDAVIDYFQKVIQTSEPKSSRLTENTEYSQLTYRLEKQFPAVQWDVVCSCLLEMMAEKYLNQSEKEKLLQ